MTNEEILLQSMTIAQSLDNHGDVGKLIKNAAQIYEYLKNGYVGAEKQLIPQPVTSDMDAASFIERLTLRHPIKGEVPFKLMDHQKKIINYLENSRCLVINSGRQMGITNTMAAYAVYEATSKSNQTALWLSVSMAKSYHGMEIIRHMAEQADMPLKESNKGSIAFDNGSRIIARSIAANVGCGLSINRLFIDDAGYIPKKLFADAWKNLYVDILTGASVVMASSGGTVVDNVFHAIWVSGGHPWRKLLIPWYEHPERTEEWAKQYILAISQRAFDQEHCCGFTLSESSD